MILSPLFLLKGSNKKIVLIQLLIEAIHLGLFCQEFPAFQLSNVTQSSQKIWLKTYGPLFNTLSSDQYYNLYFTEDCLSTKATDL
jgi:hypothetical protein